MTRINLLIQPIQCTNRLWGNKGHRIANNPRNIRQRLQRFITRESPTLARKPRLGDNHSAPTISVRIQPLGSILPVLGHFCIRTFGGDSARPCGRCSRQSQQPNNQGQGHNGVALKVEPAVKRLPRRQRRAQWRLSAGGQRTTLRTKLYQNPRPCQTPRDVGNSHQQWDTNQRIKLVDITQRHPCSV